MGNYNFGSSGPFWNDMSMIGSVWNGITTTTTPAVGSCEVQFVFKDAAGVTMAVPVAGQFYISEVSTGLTVDVADTSIVVATNGVITIVDTGAAKYYNFVTTAAGLLGITITATADNYWIVFVHPSGKLVISDVCVSSGA